MPDFMRIYGALANGRFFGGHFSRVFGTFRCFLSVFGTFRCVFTVLPAIYSFFSTSKNRLWIDQITILPAFLRHFRRFARNREFLERRFDAYYAGFLSVLGASEGCWKANLMHIMPGSYRFWVLRKDAGRRI